MLEAAWARRRRPTARRRRDRAGVPEGGEALVEDLFAVRDEEQARARQRLAEARVVDRGHDGFPVPVADTSKLRWWPRSRDSAICSSRRSWNGSGRSSMGLRQRRGPASLRPARSRASELVRVVGHEVAAVPVALEHRRDLVDDIRVARAGHAHVPLEPADLRGVRQIGRADVGRREAGLAMKEPRLRMQPRGGRVVGDAHLGTERRGARRARAPRSSRCTSWSEPAAAARAGSGARSASRSGAMPLRRMNAMTTSMRSAESISVRSWLPTRGSPGALVRSVVSSSGMSGSGIASSVPSGRWLSTARRTVPGSTGVSGLALAPEIRTSIWSMSFRARFTPTRSSSSTPATVR